MFVLVCDAGTVVDGSVFFLGLGCAGEQGGFPPL